MKTSNCKGNNIDISYLPPFLLRDVWAQYRLVCFKQQLHLANGLFRNYLVLATHCEFFLSHDG